jgi:hypothetical protein
MAWHMADEASDLEKVTAPDYEMRETKHMLRGLGVCQSH